jgi:hypothetical protein
VLSAQAVTEGDSLPLSGPTFFDGGTIDNSSGAISLIFDTLSSAVPGASGTGVLAHLSFTALAAGASTLQFANLIALDTMLNDVWGSERPVRRSRLERPRQTRRSRPLGRLWDCVEAPFTLEVCGAGNPARSRLSAGRTRRNAGPQPE